MGQDWQLGSRQYWLSDTASQHDARIIIWWDFILLDPNLSHKSWFIIILACDILNYSSYIVIISNCKSTCRNFSRSPFSYPPWCLPALSSHSQLNSTDPTSQAQGELWTARYKRSVSILITKYFFCKAVSFFVLQNLQHEISEIWRSAQFYEQHALTNLHDFGANFSRACLFLLLFEYFFPKFWHFPRLYLIDVFREVIFIVLVVFLFQVFNSKWATIPRIVNEEKLFSKVFVMEVISIFVRNCFCFENLSHLNQAIHLSLVELKIFFKNGSFCLVRQIFKSFVRRSLKNWCWDVIFLAEIFTIDLGLNLMKQCLIEKQSEFQKHIISRKLRTWLYQIIRAKRHSTFIIRS